MATLRDFVRRFRPAGTPGAAAPAGVPADRVSERAAELGPVFDALQDTVSETEAVVAGARREAERRRMAAAQRVAELLADAQQEADAARASAAAAAIAVAAGEQEDLLDQAHRDAAEIRSRASEQLPILVDRVVAAVKAATRAGHQVRTMR
jgi:ABC-type nitrate/sulfonate/bicarbonate transport system substrate-binding protein